MRQQQRRHLVQLLRKLFQTHCSHIGAPGDANEALLSLVQLITMKTHVRWKTRCANTKCQYESTTNATQPIVQLQVTSSGASNLLELLQTVQEWTQLTEDNAFKCDKCLQYTRAQRRMKFTSFSKPVLLLSLARATATMQKLQTPVRLPETFKLVNKRTNSEASYVLQSVIHHFGSTMRGGHYVTELPCQRVILDDARVIRDKLVSRFVRDEQQGSSWYESTTCVLACYVTRKRK